MRARVVNKSWIFLKEFFLIFGVAVFVLWLNRSMIHFNMMYPEQPIIYFVNQSIHHFSDLLNVYLHPRMLDAMTVPFFRPSGHFLIYQLVTPFIGWHNTKALIGLNLVFLGLTAYLMIKVYALLFPGFKWGGFIAAAIYVMHPALSLSKLIILHFDFAYVFFLMLSLYCFILFLQNNSPESALNKQRLFYYPLLLGSVFFYVFAVTFKESALLLAPALMIYLFLWTYKKNHFLDSIKLLLVSSDVRKIFILLFIFFALLAIYLTLPWPTMDHPLRSMVHGDASNLFAQRVVSLDRLTQYLFALPNPPFSMKMFPEFVAKPILWGFFVASKSTRLSLWWCYAAVMMMLVVMYFDRSEKAFHYKKSLCFLLASSFLYLLLPIVWGMGFAWHLSLTILMLSIVMGFSVDFLLSLVSSQRIHIGLCIVLSLIISLFALPNNRAVIYFYNQIPIFNILRNAVFHPVLSSPVLNSHSLIVIENSKNDSYMMGTGWFPIYSYLQPAKATKKDNSDSWIDATHLLFYLSLQGWSARKLDANENGLLFKWAYLNPSLQEEDVPFTVKEMGTKKVSDFAIYYWLRHANNIFCYGFNEKTARWVDDTVIFKRALMIEAKKRKIYWHQYAITPGMKLSGVALKPLAIPYADPHLCEYVCDRKSFCKGFTYISSNISLAPFTECQLFVKITNNNTPVSPIVTGYVKT